jgi:hypothetical protein
MNMVASVAESILDELKEAYPGRRTPPTVEDWQIEQATAGILGGMFGRAQVARFHLTSEGQRMFNAAVRKSVRAQWAGWR